MELTEVGIWTDPSCPWAWQVAKWVIDLRARGLIRLDWRIFSLEVNAAGPDTLFGDAAPRGGDALVTLELAHREGGNEAFERLYTAMGRRLHDDGEEISTEILRGAASAAGLDALVDRAVGARDLQAEVVRAYRDARRQDVFGVPTLQIGGAKPIYGPIIPSTPVDGEAVELWNHVRWLAERPDFFELKRWPRDARPLPAGRRDERTGGAPRTIRPR